MNKPHVWGDYKEQNNRFWEYDIPLFSKWTVSWTEPAGCRHAGCGEEWMDKEFATWVDAIAFANNL